ncbi:MAG: class I SAM-dependent methyltransferase [Deltaproteobacteria bacterium]|nr:class I SAM-dependent methyltransferase [Deltaproteobacteria bacterium]
MARILSGRAAETREHEGAGGTGAAQPSGAERAAAREALASALAAHELPADSPPPPLVDYLALLVRWRARRRLAGPAEPLELAIEALVDTWLVDDVVPRDGTLFDVGSGAGFPGIPLAVLGRERRVTLVEPSAARAALLRVAAATLGLPVRVLAVRGEHLADEIAAGREPPADTAIARAFRSPEEWLALAGRLVRPGGSAIVLAARTWTGPERGGAWAAVERRDYSLRGRAPRSAWRLHSSSAAEPSSLP